MSNATSCLDIQSSPSLPIFRQQLKTFLFRKSFPHILLWHFCSHSRPTRFRGLCNSFTIWATPIIAIDIDIDIDIDASARCLLPFGILLRHVAFDMLLRHVAGVDGALDALEYVWIVNHAVYGSDDFSDNVASSDSTVAVSMRCTLPASMSRNSSLMTGWMTTWSPRQYDTIQYEHL